MSDSPLTALRRKPSAYLAFVGITALASILTACDAIDSASQALRSAASSSQSDSGAHEPTSNVSASRGRPGGQADRGDMESVGPEGALRVYYQFTDDHGRVQFVERLTDVPDAWRDRVGFVEMPQAPPLTPAEARKSWKLSATRSAEIILAANIQRQKERAGPTRRRMDDFNSSQDEVILYSASWCGYCTQAKAHLDREGIDYELRDVDIKAVSSELREKTGRGGVPVLDFGGEILRGYSAGRYGRAIQQIRG